MMPRVVDAYEHDWMRLQDERRNCQTARRLTTCGLQLAAACGGRPPEATSRQPPAYLLRRRRQSPLTQHRRQHTSPLVIGADAAGGGEHGVARCRR